MTCLDAARTILKAAGQPLHYEAITERALAQKLVAPATIGSRLYTDTLRQGSRFVRAGRGTCGLAQWQPQGIDAHVSRVDLTPLPRYGIVRSFRAIGTEGA